MQKPKVSIVMPTFKKLDYLKVALNSVFNQTYNDYEIIITDDSPDEVIKDYVMSLGSDKIRYFNNKPPLFQAANHTNGMKQSKGEFIKILHDDDYFLTNDALEKMVKLLEDNPECDFAYVNNIQMDLLTNKIIKKRHAEKYVDSARKDPLNLLYGNGIGAPSVTIFRNYNDVFFEGHFKCAIDTDFYITYLLKHPKIAFSKEYLIAIGENPEQDTHKVAGDKTIIIPELVYIYKKNEEFIKVSKSRKAIEKSINARIASFNIKKDELDLLLKSTEHPEFIKVKKKTEKVLLMPKISIIIPIYNVEKYLKECLDSVVNQTLTDIEVICIDDSSPDKCGEIIDEYAKKDLRIKAIHKPNGGYGAACNLGLEKAIGEYVAIVEPDDFIELDMYEKLYELAKLHDVEIVKSCFYENYDLPDYKKIVKKNWSKKLQTPTEVFNAKTCSLFLSLHPSVWSCIYQRDFLDKNNIRFVEAKGAGWTDNPFQVQTMCLAQRIFYTDEAYYYWRRLNTDGSKDLNNFTIPFKRSDEIHNWLDENDINDENILAHLYTRELSYIKIVLGMLKTKDIKAASILIKSTVNRMDEKIINKNPAFTKVDKNLVKKIKNHLLLMILLKKINRIGKEIINIRWSSSEKRLVLFGKTMIGVGHA